MMEKLKETPPQNVVGGEVGEGPRGAPNFRIAC